MMEKIIIEIDEEKEKMALERYATFYQIEKTWLDAVVEGKIIWSFFEKRGYKKVAIYGMGELGKQFAIQMIKTGHEPIVCVDRNIFDSENGNTASKRELLDSTDVIVVTPVMEYLSIKDSLKEIYAGDVISLEEVIRSM